MTPFQQASNEYLAFLYAAEPVMATQMGVHDFDDRLPDRSPAAFAERLAKTRAHLYSIDGLSLASMEESERLDARIARANIQWNLVQLEQKSWWESQPGRYIEEAVGNLFMLMLGSDKIDRRAECILDRLHNIPRMLDQAFGNLNEVPVEFLEYTLEAGHGAETFLSQSVTGFAASLGRSSFGNDIKKAVDLAGNAVSRFLHRIRHEITPAAGGSFALGDDLYRYALRVYHMIDESPEELEEIGRTAIVEVSGNLQQLAAAIAPDKTWREVVGEVKKDHPTADGLVAAYEGEMARAREFVREHGLVTLPEDEQLTLIETPAFQRSIYAYAAYMPAGPFDQNQHAHFWVTPIDPARSPAEQEAQLCGHPTHNIGLIALHEAYPGHHLQFTVANRVASRYRRHFADSNLFIEGWALYCEEMMRDAGFYSDPRALLLQAKAELWRACRVVIDVGLHTGKMSPAEAVQFLVEQGGLEEVAAHMEVRRYCMTPTQPMTYLMGKRMIMGIRDRYKKRMGAAFNLRQFHDDLLSRGAIQPRLLQEFFA